MEAGAKGGAGARREGREAFDVGMWPVVENRPIVPISKTSPE